MSEVASIPTPSVPQVQALLVSAARILVVTHISPDGDAWGSALGLGAALQAAGKEVVCACADPISESFRFLPGAADTTTEPTGAFDLIIAVDVSEVFRMGNLRERLGRAPHLLFDHHYTNPGFADLNIIDASTAATAELIALWLPRLGLPLTPAVAECLLTGIITDTLGLRTATTTPQTLAVAQQLMAAGANWVKVYDQAFYKRSFSAVRLWAEGLARIKLENGLVWTRLPLAARKAAAYGGTGDADLINVLASVREGRIALIFVERTDGRVKISWRCEPPLNVAQLAQAFGGGGHAGAAGAEVVGTLDEVESQVIKAAKEYLKSVGPK